MSEEQRVLLEGAKSMLRAVGTMSGREKDSAMDSILRGFTQSVVNLCKKNLNIPLEGEDIGHEAICYVVRDKETGKPKIKQILMSFPAGKEYVIKEGEENGFEGTPSEKEDRRR
jgi:hypothetical protein